MNINKSFHGFYVFNGFFVFLLLSLLSASVFAANYPLEIIQPQPNLDINNRFYKAYPGLEYNVRLAVIGGDYPFLVEDNTLHQIGGHPLGPKEGTQMWFIQSNRMYKNSQDSIGLQYSDSNGIQSGDIEISYNLVETGGGKLRINSNQMASGLPVYIFRNTFMDDVQQNRTTSSNGPFYWSKNVIVNETSYPEKIERWKIEDPSRVVVTNNLTGSAADNIVDAQGYLTSKYSTYVGQRGHQLGKRPLSPKSLTVN